jgi:hypothetical protein
MHRDRFAILFRLLLVWVFLGLLFPPAVRAHGGHVSPIQTFTQQVGPYELAITIELPTAVPAPLYLVITPQGAEEQLRMQFRAVPRGFPLDQSAVAEVQTYPGSKIYYSELSADRGGDWELDVRVSGPRGDGQARVPFIITPDPIPSETIALGVSLGGMLLFMLTSLASSAIARGRQKPVPAWLDRALGYAIFACLVAAVIYGWQQFSNQLAQATRLPTYGRPHVNALVSTDPTVVQPNQPFTLTIDLSDGSTGLPVDDIVTHHDALVHLVLIDQSGMGFSHIHPANLAPGRFALTTTLPHPGIYTAYIEVERINSGTQIIERPIVVAGAPPAAVDPPGFGERTIDGLMIDVQPSRLPVQAKRQTTITLTVRDAASGQAIIDIEPWLGMAGHLIACRADGSIYGHIHAVGAMPTTTTSVQQIAPPSYGPDIQFVYTFPQTGRYLLWAQFQHGGRIITVPFMVEVT